MNPPPRQTPSLPWQIRGALALVGAALAVLLATAATLQPSRRGFGTHQQLGLPPCTIQVLWDLRCPSCGMTTSWSWVMRGRLGEALAANAGGTLLALASLAVAPWALASAARGRWVVGPPSQLFTLCGLGGIFLVTLVDWALRLMDFL